MSPWTAAFIYVGLAALIIGGPFIAAALFRTKPKAPSPLATDTYECGEEPDGTAWVRFHPRYYLVALVFVLFDVEAAFLLPWSLNLRELGDLALKKGALKWQ
jgi:NADH:ubiquinone oxidoreductase subunit 3 (subunit A)